MLPAPFRFQLRSHSTFFSKARCSFSSSITTWYWPSSKGQFQAAFIVPKKNVKRSTDRHRLLRQLRASVANLIKSAEKLPPFQVVIMPNKQGTELGFAELQAEVVQVIKKITPHV